MWLLLLVSIWFACNSLNLVQVKRLVVVETEEMYKARKEHKEKHQALRPPLVVNHFPTSSESSQG